MDITELGYAITVEVQAVTVVAISVLCGTALAQSANALAEPDSSCPHADLTSQVNPAELSDPWVSSLTSDDVQSAATSEATRPRVRSFGTSSNGAPWYTRSNVDVEPWRNLPGLRAAFGYRTELFEVSSRWWFSTGRTDVGFGVGSVALVANPTVGAVAADAAVASIALVSSPSLSVGIRRRTSDVSTLYADATRARSIGVSGIDSYSGKVGVEWKTAESRWSIAYSGLGMRLSSESRMTVSLRKGGLGIYMRSQF